MDISVFNEARDAYAVGNYSSALDKFIECAQDLDGLSTEDLCKFYNLLGNCYVKCGKASVASAAYSMALTNANTKRKPVIYANLGKSLLSCGKNTQALVAFNNALQFKDYAAPYKAYSGIGSAQLQLGNIAEAGAAYREAAVDPNNPAPAKSLVNLGACFMEMGRAEDAIISYETALNIGLEGEMQNKANANLGQAYMVQGRFFDALSAFEDALEDGSYELNDLAAHDYQIALSLDERFGEDLEKLYQEKSEELFGDDGEILPPYKTGEIDLEGSVFSDQDEEAADLSNAQTIAFEPPQQDAFEQDEDDLTQRFDNSTFFARVNEEEIDADNMFEPSPSPYANVGENAFENAPYQFDGYNQNQAAHKKKKKHGAGFVILITIIIILVLAAAGCVAGYALGYGYPLQETVAKNFFNAACAEQDTTQYWASDVEEQDRNIQLQAISNVVSTEVVAVERSMSQSSVYVKAQLQAGGELYYKIVMKRDKLTWLVEYVELYYPNMDTN